MLVVETGLELLPIGSFDGDRQVVVPAEHLLVRAEVEPGEVEVGEGVAMTDVEEEVRRAP